MHSLLFMLSATMLASAGSAESPESSLGSSPVPLLTLSGQRAALELDESAGATAARLTFLLTASSRLTAPVEAIRIGILYAEAEPAIESADVAAYYRAGTSLGGEVATIVRWVDVRLGPNAEATVTFSLDVAPDSTPPRVFVTHVLGYRLASARAALLLSLLDTSSACDEVAAVQTLALGAEPSHKARVRARWGADAALVASLSDRVLALVPERPTQQETFERVYGLLALGVLGGQAATAALAEAAGLPGLERFDEPLQILRVARLTGAPLETPLAFAISSQARVMRDIVSEAQADLTGWFETETETEAPPPPGVDLDPLNAGAPEVSRLRQFGLPLVTFLIIFCAAWLLVRRFGRRPEDSER